MNEVPAGCLPFDEDLSALLDEELSTEREVEVREHLAGCARCAQRLEALCDVDLTLASLPAPQVPADLGARLAARLAAEARPEPAPVARLRPRAAPARRRLAARPAIWLAAAAAAALAVWVAVTGQDAVAPPAPVAVTPPPPPRELPPSPPTPEPGRLVAAEEPAPPPRPPAPVAPEPTRVVESKAPPAEAPLATEPPLELAEAGLPELADLEESDVALLLELDAVQDLEVIANLDLLERFLVFEARRGAG